VRGRVEGEVGLVDIPTSALESPALVGGDFGEASLALSSWIAVGIVWGPRGLRRLSPPAEAGNPGRCAGGLERSPSVSPQDERTRRKRFCLAGAAARTVRRRLDTARVARDVVKLPVSERQGSPRSSRVSLGQGTAGCPASSGAAQDTERANSDPILTVLRHAPSSSARSQQVHRRRGRLCRGDAGNQL